MIDTSDVQDPEIAKLMEQYGIVLDLMQKDCTKRGIHFFCMGYFRRWVPWNEQVHGLYLNTELKHYDVYLVGKYMKKIFKSYVTE